MKLITHYTFSAGLASLMLLPLIHYNIIIAIVLSVVDNMLIDKLGHEIKGNFIRRTPLTHTIPRSMMWGTLGAIPVIFLIYINSNSYYYHSYHYYSYLSTIAPFDILYVLIIGAVVGLSHMLLDVFTEKGIYVKKNGQWKRFALAHFRYDDPGANGLAMILGVIMLYVSMRM